MILVGQITGADTAVKPGIKLVQMLVYENYNKFVTATDTIKVMNSSMGGMDASMTQLKQLIGEAGGQGSEGERRGGPAMDACFPQAAWCTVLCVLRVLLAPQRADCWHMKKTAPKLLTADNVVEQSNSVNGKLQHRQDHIEELNQVRMLLHKLQVMPRCEAVCKVY